jgi:hypothetical protein
MISTLYPYFWGVSEESSGDSDSERKVFNSQVCEKNLPALLANWLIEKLGVLVTSLLFPVHSVAFA